MCKYKLILSACFLLLIGISLFAQKNHVLPGDDHPILIANQPEFSDLYKGNEGLVSRHLSRDDSTCYRLQYHCAPWMLQFLPNDSGDVYFSMKFSALGGETLSTVAVMIYQAYGGTPDLDVKIWNDDNGLPDTTDILYSTTITHGNLNYYDNYTEIQLESCIVVPNNFHFGWCVDGLEEDSIAFISDTGQCGDSRSAVFRNGEWLSMDDAYGMDVNFVTYVDLCFGNDWDNDGIVNDSDNCAMTQNPLQEDSDSDGAGDSCDICPGFNDFADYDGDYIPDSCDNCPIDYNPDQMDTDGDGIGDECEFVCGDVNGDEIVDELDAMELWVYLYNGGSSQYLAGDVDSINGINNGDVAFLYFYVNAGGPFPYCPPYPDSTPIISSDSIRIRNTVIPPYQDSCVVDIVLKATDTVWAFSLPLTFACSTGEISCSDISFPGHIDDAFSLHEGIINNDSHKVVLAGINTQFNQPFIPGNDSIIASITFSVTSDENAQFVIIDTCSFYPSNTTIFSRGSINTGQPPKAFIPNIFIDLNSSDYDYDGISNDNDNCPFTFNPNQDDYDNDTVGDSCDDCTDSDSDGYGNPGFPANTCELDNCPDNYNPDQADLDNDGIGDECDLEFNGISVRADISPQVAPDTIGLGIPFYVDIYMNNNSDIVINGFSMPLVFFSPDQSVTMITHVDDGGEGPYGNILTLNGFEQDGYFDWDEFYPINTWSWDGNLPDTFCFQPITMTTGWPSGLGEQIYIRFYFEIEEEGIFCVDSLAPSNPTYDWLFQELTVFNGPYCWDVYTCADTDNDGVCNSIDNCPAIYNPDQSNIDDDSLGDLCDDDIDGDGYLNGDDNCPYSYNPDQEDSDLDGIGDICDKDSIYIVIENNQDSTGIRDSSFIVEIELKTVDTITGGNLGFTWADGNACWQLDTVIFGPELEQWDFHEHTPPDGPNGSDLNSWVAIGGAAFPGNPYLMPDTTYQWAALHFSLNESAPQWTLGSQMVFDSSFVPPANTVTLAHSGGAEITPCIGNPIILFPADIDTDFVADIYDNCPEIYNPLQEDTNGNGIGDLCEGCCEMAGDASHSGVLNIFDITYIISYLYLDGPPPQCYDEAEVNADNLVNIFDITYLIAYLYQDGPAPTCGTTGS